MVCVPMPAAAGSKRSPLIPGPLNVPPSGEQNGVSRMGLASSHARAGKLHETFGNGLTSMVVEPLPVQPLPSVNV